MPEPMIRTGAFTWTPKQSPEPLVVPLLGRLEGATNPESADMLLDGEHFVFGNCTMSLDHPARSLGHVLIYMKDEAFISLGRIGPDKKVELVKRKVADHLTATLGVDVLKADNAAVGAGVAFIAEGGHPVPQGQGRSDRGLPPPPPRRRCARQGRGRRDPAWR